MVAPNLIQAPKGFMKSLHRSGSIAVLALVATLGASRPAHATPEADLAAAENAYAALDYGPALAGAEAVLQQRGLGHDVLTRATRVAALSHAALGHGEQAKQMFSMLLEYDPDFKVESKLGPRFVEPFSEARGYWQAQGRRAGMDVQVTLHWGQPGVIRVATVDPLGLVKRVNVAFRWAPGREYTTTTLEPGVRSVEVPANSGGASRLDYFVRANDVKDSAVFEDGSSEAPKIVTVNEPPREAGFQAEKKSIFASPAFYAVAGVLVVGAAVGGFFLFRPTEYTPSSSARGTLFANCGSERCN